MNENILHTIFLAGVFLILFASAELLYHKFKVKAEITRNYVHIITGLLTMLVPPLIENHWLVMALSGSFLIILTAYLLKSSSHCNLANTFHGIVDTCRNGR